MILVCEWEGVQGKMQVCRKVRGEIQVCDEGG